jgi:hypothetical protein
VAIPELALDWLAEEPLTAEAGVSIEGTPQRLGAANGRHR